MSDQLLQNPAVRDVHDYLESTYGSDTAARHLKVMASSQIRLLLGVPETERRQLSSAIQYLVRQGAIFTKPLPSDSRLNLYYLGEED